MKKIIHFCNYSPIDSGIYPETRDLVIEELRRGYDAWIVDHIPNNPFRLNPDHQDDLYKKGRIIGIEQFDEATDADLIGWHSWIPKSYMNDPKRLIVMFLHAMPSHVFYNELYGGESILTFLKSAHETVPNCRYFITLWPSHAKYWENIIAKNLVVTKPIIASDCIRLKSDTHFDPQHLKLAVMDTWRAGKEPFYIINAVQCLMEQTVLDRAPFGVSLNIYGQSKENVQPVWNSLIRDEHRARINFKGKQNPQDIFDHNDILLTQVGEIATESRVIREGLLSGIPIVSGMAGVDWADYHHDIRDLEGYADTILRCWKDISDTGMRVALHRKNRAYACMHYDVRKNSDPIFQCYESVFKEMAVSGSGSPAPDGGSLSIRSFQHMKQALQAFEGNHPIEEMLSEMQAGNEYMDTEEALLRFMKDLPRSG